MQRRTFLASASAVVAGFSGCLGDGSPTPDATPTEDGSFETLSVGDVAVPLVPVDVAHDWYQSSGPRFVDARGPGQYRAAHITDAVSSPARSVEDWSKPRDDPTTNWDADERIVCYCGCPHHLSSLRAGEFIDAGYEDVYAIDEGFFAWTDRGYPVTGTEVTRASYVIRGRTDPSAVGEYAWATHEPSGQREAAPIDGDGAFELELHFHDVDESSVIHLRTPQYELRAPVSRLTGVVVTSGSERERPG